MKEKEPMLCVNCSYCNRFQMIGNRTAEFSCSHPDEKYITQYFQEHNLVKMPGFLGHGYDEVPIKTSPRWCPLRRKET